MRFFSLVFSVFMLFSLAGNCKSYDVIYDRDLSPYVGGQSLLTGFQVLCGTEDLILKPKKNPPRGFGPVLGRAIEQLLIWAPLGEFASTTQHEFFGHGYRIRDIGKRYVKEKKYQFNLPNPYGNGNAVTEYSFNRKLTMAHSSLISVAGLESQSILAKQLKMKWLDNKSIDPRTAVLYNFSQQMILLYKFVDNEKSSINYPTSLDQNGVKPYLSDLGNDVIDEIQSLSIKAFKSLCCQGMARVDFFLKEDGTLLVNELNTIPGFTQISLYPKLWSVSGIPFQELIDRLLELALESKLEDSCLSSSMMDIF
jgi:hypothetical protein